MTINIVLMQNLKLQYLLLMHHKNITVKLFPWFVQQNHKSLYDATDLV